MSAAACSIIRAANFGGISELDIKAEGEVYGLMRSSDFSGGYSSSDKRAYINASLRVDNKTGRWLQNANGAILHLTPQREQVAKVLSIPGDVVVIRLGQHASSPLKMPPDIRRQPL
jgi:hypothetical protein